MEKNKVLIVDDEPKICSILSALLTKNNYKVQVANCGEAGVDMYGEFQPAVVVKRTIQGVIESRDEVLEAAIGYLRSIRTKESSRAGGN